MEELVLSPAWLTPLVTVNEREVEAAISVEELSARAMVIRSAPELIAQVRLLASGEEPPQVGDELKPSSDGRVIL